MGFNGRDLVCQKKWETGIPKFFAMLGCSKPLSQRILKLFTFLNNPIPVSKTIYLLMCNKNPIEAMMISLYMLHIYIYIYDDISVMSIHKAYLVYRCCWSVFIDHTAWLNLVITTTKDCMGMRDPIMRVAICKMNPQVLSKLSYTSVTSVTPN